MWSSTRPRPLLWLFARFWRPAQQPMRQCRYHFSGTLELGYQAHSRKSRPSNSQEMWELDCLAHKLQSHRSRALSLTKSMNATAPGIGLNSILHLAAHNFGCESTLGCLVHFRCPFLIPIFWSHSAFCFEKPSQNARWPQVPTVATLYDNFRGL